MLNKIMNKLLDVFGSKRLPWNTSDYEDEVTDADLERLRAHVRENFGQIPENAVVIDGPAW